MKKELSRAYIALGVVSFFWGTTYIASRIGAQHMPGLFVSGVRQFTSGLILVSFFLARGYSLPGWKALKRISLQGILLLCVANGLLTWSLEYISSGLAAIIAAMVPLFITIFTLLLSRCAKVTRLMIIGMIIGFGGVLTIFYDYIGQLQNKGFVFGVLLALFSTLSWSFGTVYTSKQKLSIDIMFNVGLQMLIAGMVMLIVCGLTGKYVNLADTGHASWYALLYLVFFGSLLAYSAWLLLQEKMNVNMILGTLITLAGVWMVNREFKKLRSSVT